MSHRDPPVRLALHIRNTQLIRELKPVGLTHASTRPARAARTFDGFEVDLLAGGWVGE